MHINISPTKESMGKAAAEQAAEILNNAINKNGRVSFIAATGASQFEFINHLIRISSIDWSKTTMFHLDEYIGLPESHPASFRKYLRERLIDKVNPGKVYLIEGDAQDPEKECERLNKIISQKKIDVAFVGIGENGHLAFNDPPADFDIEDPYIIVKLDEACRRQQLGEGWFKTFEDVPQKAISMSIKQIMKSKNIICTIPDKRKAEAVKNCFMGAEISPEYPASILKKHKNCFVFLDDQSSIYLK
jgi:glucosamine-6-phosphate deaminase